MLLGQFRFIRAVTVLTVAVFIVTQPAFSAPSAATATAKLFKYLEDYLQTDYTDAKPQIENWVREGADLSQINSWGANAFSVATETYATLFAADQDLKKPTTRGLLEGLRFLLSVSPDISSPDHRGVTPLHYLVRYGNPDGTNFVDEYLAKKPDLKKGGFSLATIILSRANESLLKKMLLIGPSLGFSFAQISPKLGSSLMGMTRRQTPLIEGKIPIEYILAKLTAKEVLTHITAQDSFGDTLLTRAVLYGNIPAVQILLRIPKVNVNQQTWDGMRPLMVSKMIENPELTRLLQANGAKERKLSTGLECHKENDVTMTIETIWSLVQKCRLKSIEELLPLIPKRVRARAVVTYKGHGLQKASVAFPRIFIFEPDGKFVATFNGDKSQGGFTDFEMIQYRPEKKIELFNLDFSGKDAKKLPSLSEANPQRCIHCHGQDPRHFWDTWSLWGGSRGGEMAQVNPAWPYEQPAIDHFEKLQKNKHPRYRHIFADANAYIRTEYGINTAGSSHPNYAFNYVTRLLVGEKVARQAREMKVLTPYRYALLAALSCRDAIQNFIPNGKQKNFSLNLPALIEDTKKKNSEEFQKRLEFHASVFPDYPSTGIGRYTRYTLERLGGRNFDPERIGAVRYIVENLAGPESMSDWFRVFGDGEQNYYVEDYVTPWETSFWREFLDPIQDKKLYDLYAGAHKQAFVGEPALTWLYVTKSPLLDQLCPMLKTASLTELSK